MNEHEKRYWYFAGKADALDHLLKTESLDDDLRDRIRKLLDRAAIKASEAMGALRNAMEGPQ